MLERMQPGSFEREALELELTIRQMGAANGTGDVAGARKLGAGVGERLVALKPPVASMEARRDDLFANFLEQSGLAALYAGDYSAAEQHFLARADYLERLRQQQRTLWLQREAAENSTYLAIALARLGRPDEARPLAEASLKLNRELYARKHDEAFQHLQLARALYAAALADPAKAKALLGEAQAVIGALPAQMRETRNVNYWRSRIAEEQQAKRRG
jgi:hypothetical protein